MIAWVAPSDTFFDENLSTLSYATKTGQISNEPVKNFDPKSKAMKDLQSELSSLRTELTDAYKQIELARYSQDKHVRRSL